MGFIATEPLPVKNDPDQERVVSDEWFPAIVLADMRTAMRLDGTVTAARLKTAVHGAVMQVNQELHAWQMVQKEAGYAALADVPASTIDHRSVLIEHYLRAVYYLGTAELHAQYRDFDSTHTGIQHAVELESRIDEDRRLARQALRAILHKTPIMVELI